MRHAGYVLSQTIRKRVEEHFGWCKTVGRIQRTVYRGIRRVDQHFKLTMTATDIVRIARMLCVVRDRLKHLIATRHCAIVALRSNGFSL